MLGGPASLTAAPAFQRAAPLAPALRRIARVPEYDELPSASENAFAVSAMIFMMIYCAAPPTCGG